MKFVKQINLLLFTDESDSTWQDVRRYTSGEWERRMGQSWEKEHNHRLESEYRRMVASGSCPDDNTR